MLTLPRTGALVATLLLQSPIAAAQGPPLVLGARVRVTTTTAKETGLYRGADLANLMLEVDATTRTIPRGTIEKLEQSMGKKPNVTTGIVGLLLGAAVGGALGCLANKDDYGVYCGGQDDTKVIVGAALGGLAGAAAGALLFKKEGWQAVTLTP
jgi:hypothetical protein